VSVFTIELSSQERMERIEGVVSFVGYDESGSFGILAHRAPLATSLAWGLCRFHRTDGVGHYLALPGGMLFFDGEVLHIATSRYLRDEDPRKIIERLTEEERLEEKSAHEFHELLQRLDHELLRRLFA
jgi:F-type H+-transporting ATPase subunit epsilon